MRMYNKFETHPYDKLYYTCKSIVKIKEDRAKCMYVFDALSRPTTKPHMEVRWPK